MEVKFYYKLNADTSRKGSFTVEDNDLGDISMRAAAMLSHINATCYDSEELKDKNNG